VDSQTIFADADDLLFWPIVPNSLQEYLWRQLKKYFTGNSRTTT